MASPPQHQSTGYSLPNMLDLDPLVRKVQDVQDVRQKMQQLQERKNNEALQGSSQLNELDPTKSKVQKLQTDIQQLEDKMKQLAETRVQLLNESTDCLDQCQSRWISRLKEWRWEQQKAAIGHPFDDDLNPLQSWCEQLFEVNKNLRKELQLVGEPMPELQDRLEKLLKVLVQSSLVVDKQPPQVIKTSSRFFTSVRLLLGMKVMPVVLKVKIINELQARDLDSVHSDDAGKLVNNAATLDSDTASRSRRATFRNMYIKKIKRPDRWDSKPVTEQKFALLFSTEIFTPDCDARFKIQIISLPVVVISSFIQGSSAQGTIIWDCAFSEEDRVPFMVPEQVSWRMLFSTLNSKFTAEVQTQRSLDQHNQQRLAQKIFNKPDCADDFSDMMVSWAQFNKELLPGQLFTFWQWFEGVMELTKTHLKTYWSQGLIFGVIEKQKLHQILRDSPAGTFLLRFSDSVSGGITISYVSAEKGELKIQSIHPFMNTNLESRSLGDRIHGIRHITHLYPDIPKHEVFKRFYSEPQTSQDYTSLPLQSGININVKDEDSPPDPVQALVLLFYRPPADPDPESLLSVFLLPKNVVRTRKKLFGHEIHIETSQHCKLRPNQKYTLSMCPEDDSVLVHPKEAKFDYDNYFPSFQVLFKTIRPNINLVLRDTKNSCTVWEGEVNLLSTGVRRSCRQSSSSEKLFDIWSSFIDGISGPVLKSLLDKLFEKTVITDPEMEAAMEMPNRRDKACFVIDTVRRKGEAASSEMIEFLCELDPFLCKHLGLKLNE